MVRPGPRPAGSILAARFLVLALAIAPGLALAQSDASTGSLQGRVYDSGTNSVSGAIVVARDIDSGFTRSTVTDDKGHFQIDLLRPGTFEIRASLSGRRTELKRGIRVKLGTRVTVDLRLQPLVFKDEMVVTAVSPMVDLKSSGVASFVTAQAISDLPLKGRDFTDLVLLTPASVSGRGNAANTEVRGGQGGFNIGARSIQNSFNVDGATAQSSFFGNERGGTFKPFTFPETAIAEFHVSRSAYNLQFNAGGAVINAITRSGNNQFHGAVFAYYRDQRLVEANGLGEDAGDFMQLQYGFSIGGPIVRDRLHFFAALDEQDLDVPRIRGFHDFPAGRQGDWEALTGLDWSNETGPDTALNDARAALLKLDWQLDVDHLASARANLYSLPDNKNLLNPYSTAGWSNDGTADDVYESYVVSFNSVASPDITNLALFQLSSEKRPRRPNTDSLPGTQIGFDFDATFGQLDTLPNSLEEERLQIIDRLNWSIGDHMLSAGVNLEFLQFDNLFFRFGGGFYLYAGWHDFLDRGIPFLYRQAFSDNGGRVIFDTDIYSVYLQDDWQVTPNLSLGFGLRYDYQRHKQMSSTAEDGPSLGQIPDDWDNLAPRTWFAWDIVGDGKSVLRGGAGVFYDPIPSVLDATVMLNNGVEVFQVTSLCWFGGTCPTYPDLWSSTATLPPDARPDVFIYDPYFENAQTFRMSIGYERELSPNVAVSADLVVSRARHLERKQDQNLEPSGDWTVDGRPVYQTGTVYPDYGRVVMFRSDASAHYTSAAVSVHKRYSGRWYLDASYTWSRGRDNDSNERSVSASRLFPDDQYDLDAEWGPSNFDVTHKLVISGGIDLPHGFKLSGIVFSRSGFPYSATHGDDLNRDGYFEGERSVIESPSGSFIHVGRNTFRQGAFSTIDLRLSKSFTLGPHVDLAVVGEVFNLFNRINWYTTNWQLSSGCYFDGETWIPCAVDDDFGSGDIPGDPRQFQIGLKLSF